MSKSVASKFPAENAAPVAATNSALQKQREAAVPRGVANILPVFIDRARNAEMWDVEGKRYIDFASGIAVLNIGHNHPKVMAAVAAQMEKFSHTCFQVTPYENYVRLADRLNKLAPGPTPKKTIFLSTGAEAVENAIKIARAFMGRPAVISFTGAFHGRTMMGMALTGKVAPYKAGFGPFPAGIYHAPFPVAYHGVTVEDSLRALESLFKADVEPTGVAAIIIEPVQGEGGFYIAPPAFLKALRRICDEHGIVLIADEIQTGFARTGKMFAIEHAGIEADLVVMAKSLADGFPLSAVTGKAKIMDAPGPGGLGGTYAGSPIACAAAEAVLDVIEGEKLCTRAITLGRLIEMRLWSMAETNELKSTIGDIRALGAMVAVELIDGGDAAKPAADLTKTLVQACAREGLVVLPCGVRGNVIRFLAPLTAPEKIVEEGMDIFESALKRLAVSRKS
ncbi:MAG: 4-aminobutyrate--2-oxoglutarate transaminase [Rhodospirillales bacterium]|nr:4-aminobutyrate--2-oxoglutarate transaminase [Rhodospirillales bacterium]